MLAFISPSSDSHVGNWWHKNQFGQYQNTQDIKSENSLTGQDKTIYKILEGLAFLSATNRQLFKKIFQKVQNNLPNCVN